ncbi:hypothetical protein [Rhizobium sp. IMFF44]
MGTPKAIAASEGSRDAFVASWLRGVLFDELKIEHAAQVKK